MTGFRPLAGSSWFYTFPGAYAPGFTLAPASQAECYTDLLLRLGTNSCTQDKMHLASVNEDVIELVEWSGIV
jgi:hypothetical protein